MGIFLGLLSLITWTLAVMTLNDLREPPTRHAWFYLTGAATVHAITLYQVFKLS